MKGGKWRDQGRGEKKGRSRSERKINCMGEVFDEKGNVCLIGVRSVSTVHGQTKATRSARQVVSR